MFAPPAASADITYCSGYYGVTVWTGFNYTGTGRTFCGGPLAAISVPDLRYTSVNLDNQISSAFARNAPSSSKRFCFYNGYNYAQDGIPVLSLIGNGSIPDFTKANPSTMNNRSSSMRSRPSGLYCP